MVRSVLLLSFEMTPPMVGGIGSVAKEMINEFAHKGYITHVISPCSITNNHSVYYYSIPLKRNPVKFIVMFIKGIRFLVKQKVDFIYSTTGTYAGMTAYLLSKIFNIPYVVIAHGNEFIRFYHNKIIKQLLRNVYNNALIVFAISTYTKTELVKFNITSEILICYNGVNPSVYFPLEKKEKVNIRERLEISGDCFVLLTISRLDKRKGHCTVMAALKEIVKKNTNIVYLIGGTGPEEVTIKNMIDEYELKDYVRCVGYIQEDEINNYYNAADLFIMPNIYIKDQSVEGFGLVFLEAAAAGIPGIGGIVGGSSDAIIHGKTGLLVDGTDIREVQKSIEILMDDRKLLIEYGQNAYVRSKEFSWEKIATHIESAIIKKLQNK